MLLKFIHQQSMDTQNSSHYPITLVRQKVTQIILQFMQIFLPAIGDNNGHENPFILAINIVWAKWHNLIAEKLYSINPYWPDWRLFEEARRWVIASQQV